MSEKRTLDARKTAELLLSFKRPTVIMHTRPDGDTVGSAAALIAVFEQLGIAAQYACADKIPKRLAFLAENLTCSEALDERELIAIDVASASQLGALSEYADRITLTIDHHRVNSPFSDNFTLPDASSAGETLFAVISELIAMKKITLTESIAYPLYAAISSDTGGFLFSSATPKTYRTAAALMECGIDYADVNHRLFHSKSTEQLRAEGFIASKIKTAAEGKIAYASLSKDERKALGALPEHFETAIDVIRSLLFAEVAVFVRENDDGTFKASIRSTELNVAEIAYEFGGGGHVRAAGCSVEAESAEQGAELVVLRIEKEFKNK